MRERSTTPTSSGDRQNASPSRNDLPSGSGQKSLDRERHGSGWQKKNFLFIHPNLGIGGAERLVVDAAVGLQELGHNVTIYTSYCNRNHCFEEVRIGTLDVRVRGDSIFPSQLKILNRTIGLHIFLATLRQFHLTFNLIQELDELKADVFIVDQLSACVPLLSRQSGVNRFLRQFGRAVPPSSRLLFYCHFPDQLLVRDDSKDKKTSLIALRRWLKKIYRWPFNWFEGWSMSFSDRVIVNSYFTKRVAQQVFGSQRLRRSRVVYPCVETIRTAGEIKAGQQNLEKNVTDWRQLWPPKRKKLLLSLNRFEKKKDVGLAIRAYHRLDSRQREGVVLVIAGGYDDNVSENVETLTSLQNLADSLSLPHCTIFDTLDAENSGNQPTTPITFLPSIPTQLKTHLLDAATILLYTPPNEHFGIVPLEAMLHACPVLARHSGGPKESIIDGETGWLRGDNDDIDYQRSEPGSGNQLASNEVVQAWSEVISFAIQDENKPAIERMGQMGRKRVEEKFSREKMVQGFLDVLDDIDAGGVDDADNGNEGQESGVLRRATVSLVLTALVMWIVTTIQSAANSSRQVEGSDGALT